jgi:hypothetical protein
MRLYPPKYVTKFLVNFIGNFGTLLACHLLDAPTLKLLQKILRNVVIYERLMHFLVKNLGYFEGDIILNSNSNLLFQFLLHYWM